MGHDPRVSRDLDEILAEVRRAPAQSPLWTEALRAAPRFGRVEATVAALVDAGALAPDPGPEADLLDRELFAAGWGLGDPYWHLAGPLGPGVLSPGFERAAFATPRHGVRVVNLVSGRVEATLGLAGAQALAFPTGGRSLVAGRVGPGATLHLARAELEGAPAQASVQVPLPRGGWTTLLDLSPCGRGVVLAGARGTAGVGHLSPWGRAGGLPSLSLVIRDQDKGACFGRISPDLRCALVYRLAAVPKAERPLGLGVYDLETGGCRDLALAYFDSSTRFHFSLDGLWVAALTARRGVLHVVTYPLHEDGPYWHVELLDQPSAFVWKPGGKAESCGFELDPRRRTVKALGSPSPTRVLAPDPLPGTGLPRVRDLVGGGLVFGPRHHPAPIVALRVRPDPPRLESYDPEGGTLVWCLATGRVLARRGPAEDPPPPTGRVLRVPAPDGPRDLVAEDGCVRLRPRA